MDRVDKEFGETERVKADMSLSLLEDLQMRLDAETQLDASAVDTANLEDCEPLAKEADCTTTVQLVLPVSGPLEIEGATATRLLNVIRCETVKAPGERIVADAADVDREEDQPDEVFEMIDVLATHTVVTPALPLTLAAKLRSEANEKRTA